MKDWILRGAVVVGLVLVGLMLRKRDAEVVLPRTPTDAVQKLFDVSDRGDARAYLELVRGDLRETLQYELSQIGPEAFQENLRKSMRDVKGLSIEEIDVRPDSAVIKATLVFTDRNEVQRIQLAREEEGWTIRAIEQALMETPPVAYGTPVFGDPPSDPVQNTP